MTEKRDCRSVRQAQDDMFLFKYRNVFSGRCFLCAGGSFLVVHIIFLVDGGCFLFIRIGFLYAGTSFLYVISSFL